MKYPLHRISQPVVGTSAKKIIEAMNEGKAISNAYSKAAATRIAKQFVRDQKTAK